MTNLKTLTVAAALAVVSIGAFAQATATTATPRIDKREASQQQRIAAGAASGQLTAKETNRLETEQARIKTVEARAKADGVVTPHERKHLHRMQNRARKHIRHQKHAAQTTK